MLYKHPWVDEMVKHIPEFESLTGMKVRYEVLPEVQGRQKFTVEMTAGSGGIDAWHASMHVEKRRAWKSGWFQPLNAFLEDKSLTAPDYDWGDVTPGAVAAVTQPDKTISALPTFVDPFVLFYRKDLFQQKGWSAPKTMAEMEDQAAKLHNPPNMYGFVARGLKNANATPWAYVIFAMGGDYLTKDGKSAIGSPEWVKSMEWYSGMLKRFAPPGVVNFNWYECSSAFMQGQVGIYYDGVNFANQFEDPAKSKIAGKVAYAAMPAGPARPRHPDVHQRHGGERAEPEQGSGVPLHHVGHQQAELHPRAAGGRRRRSGLHLERSRSQGQAEDAGRLVRGLPGKPEDRQGRPARDH